MKYFVKFIVVTFFLLVCTNTFAEEKRVVMDLTYVLNKSKAGEGAQKFLKKSYDANIKKFTEIEKGLKKEENDLLAKKNILSKEEYGKKMTTLRKKNIDYQNQKRTAVDKISTLRAQSRENLLKEIKPILETYIKENNISLVVDKRFILGGGTKNDITEVIVEKLNKDFPSLNLQ